MFLQKERLGSVDAGSKGVVRQDENRHWLGLWLGALGNICFFTEHIGTGHFCVPGPVLGVGQSGNWNG